MATKEKRKGLLSGGLFDKPFMDSKATTNSVSTKEWVLGHLIGPLGLIFVVNTIAALVEKFFTQQTGAMYGTGNVEMIMKMGGWYEVVMTSAKVLAVLIGLLNGWLIQKTESRQGRMRPWYLIFGFISIAIGCLIFLFPGNVLGEAYWYYFFFLLICYHTVGSSYFYLFRDTICSLTTRDPKEKTHIQFIRKMFWTLLSGIVIGMVFSMVVLPMWLEKDINGYPILMITMSVIAIPLLLLEYFYTRERITEDVSAQHSRLDEQKIPLRDQIKALFSNKYFVILTIIFTVGGIVDHFNRVNGKYVCNSFDFCTRVLRQEWGFDGLVMSDWNATEQCSYAEAVNAGNDLIMPGTSKVAKQLKADLKAGKLDRNALGLSAGRVLDLIFKSDTCKEF